LHNAAVEQRRTFCRPDRPITLAVQTADLAEMRRIVPWIGAAPLDALQAILVDVDRAFAAFRQGFGPIPTFRSRDGSDGFTIAELVEQDFKRLNRRKGALRLPNVGWIKLSGWRPIGGELRHAIITHRDGHWFAAVAWRAEVPEPMPSRLPPVGIDAGQKVFAMLSSGQKFKAPPSFRRIERVLAKARRRLSRMASASRNWRKQAERISRLSARADNMRADFHCKTALAIARRHSVVAIEKLELPNYARRSRRPPRTGPRHAARILAIGWNAFAARLGKLLAEHGGRLVEVAREKTSQTCTECGEVAKESRRSQATFACVRCGHTANADLNAAQIILSRAGQARRACQASRISGRQQEPVQEGAYASA
jgi:putative transposase